MLFCLYGTAVVVCLVMLVTFIRSGHFLKSLFSSALGGGISLLAVNIIGSLTGVVIAVNPLTLATAGILGLPGTIGLVLTDMLM